MDVFDLAPFNDTWYHWARVNDCFWPGTGNRSDKIDPKLSPVRLLSGIYVIAWGELSGNPSPRSDAVQYIGMTDNFKNRMGQFATSSGIHYDERYDGHSAAWRWPFGKCELMHIAFFPLLENYPPHLKNGLLHMHEALAIDFYYKTHQNTLPPLNVVGGVIEL